MQKLIQGLTLTSFVTLLSTFVLYRGGYFNAHLTSPNGGTPAKQEIPADTTKKKKKKRIIFESSKSGRAIEIEEDSIPDIKNVPPRDTTKKRPRIMAGSKSGIIFNPSDTSKKKPARIFPSSKSAPIFEPTKDTLQKKKQKTKTKSNPPK